MSGFADIVLGFVLLEAAGLFLLRRAGHGPGLHRMLPTLAAGAFLVLALRLAVSSAPRLALAAALLGALAAHAVDLRGRWMSRL